MSEKNSQKIKDIQDSQIQQSARDIINVTNHYQIGVSKEELKLEVEKLVHETVKNEMANMSEVALEVFREQTADMIYQISQSPIISEDPALLKKFGTPKLQFFLHDAVKDYASTERKETKEEIVSLLLERLQVQEDTVEQYLIDQAIVVLPQLSQPQIDLLGVLTVELLTYNGFIFSVKDFLTKQAKIYRNLHKIKSLDVEYLKLKNCCRNINGIPRHDTYIKILKAKYPLLFKYPLDSQSFEKLNSSFPFLSSLKIPVFLNLEHYTDYYFAFNSIKAITDKLPDINIDELNKVIENFKDFNEIEIKNYLTSLSPEWEKVIVAMDKPVIRNTELTPLGIFIGKRIFEKVTELKLLELQDFYKESN